MERLEQFVRVITYTGFSLRLKMKDSIKVLLFLAAVVLNILTGETRLPYGGKPSQDELKAFKRCQSKVCAARVSFCIIMKDCQRCRPKAGKKCDCCDDCFRCLGGIWRKCCDCIGLCNYFTPANGSQEIPSNIGDLGDDSLPTLFEAMSGVSHLPIMFMKKPRQGSPLLPNGGKKGSSSQKDVCKLAFFDDCLTKEDCINSCASMGSHRYRWFRNGCCQCIGHRCRDYGELRPLCKKCLAN